jgi:glutamate synthase (NADPH/NADH) small chain
LAKGDGVRFEWFVQPRRILRTDGAASGVEFVRTRLAGGTDRSAKIEALPGSEFVIEADMVVKALGQEALLDFIAAIDRLKVVDGRIVIDPQTRQTSVPRLFAGGDCISTGAEIVNAVEEGKLAARAIDVALKREQA